MKYGLITHRYKRSLHWVAFKIVDDRQLCMCLGYDKSGYWNPDFWKGNERGLIPFEDVYANDNSYGRDCKWFEADDDEAFLEQVFVDVL